MGKNNTSLAENNNSFKACILIVRPDLNCKDNSLLFQATWKATANARSWQHIQRDFCGNNGENSPELKGD